MDVREDFRHEQEMFVSHVITPPYGYVTPEYPENTN